MYCPPSPLGVPLWGESSVCIADFPFSVRWFWHLETNRYAFYSLYTVVGTLRIRQRFFRVICVYAGKNRLMLNIRPPEALVGIRPLGCFTPIILFQHGLHVSVMTHFQTETLHWLDMVQFDIIKSHLGVTNVFYIVVVHFLLNMIDYAVE